MHTQQQSQPRYLIIIRYKNLQIKLQVFLCYVLAVEQFEAAEDHQAAEDDEPKF